LIASLWDKKIEGRENHLKVLRNSSRARELDQQVDEKYALWNGRFQDDLDKLDPLSENSIASFKPLSANSISTEVIEEMGSRRWKTLPKNPGSLRLDRKIRKPGHQSNRDSVRSRTKINALRGICSHVYEDYLKAYIN